MNEWDEYAPFYDWENARTMGRRDLAFWQQFARGRGRTLELGCGTGRVLAPLAVRGRRLVGLDASAEMLVRGRQKLRRIARAQRPSLVRGDIRALPFEAGTFARVLAPYGVLQSLTSDADLDATLVETARVLDRSGWFAIDLVPDLADWRQYQRQVRFRGRLAGRDLTLIESVRQNRRRGLTIFDEEFRTIDKGRLRFHRFSLTFRTLPMETVLERVRRAGFAIDAVHGGYRGDAWRPDSPVWLVIARRA
jgi:SAM-dependent methyltransferase